MTTRSRTAVSAAGRGDAAAGRWPAAPADCPRCGYDLSGRADGDPCSECGLDLPEDCVALTGASGAGPSPWAGIVLGGLGAMQLLVIPGYLVTDAYGAAAFHAALLAGFGWLFGTWWRVRRAHARGHAAGAILVDRGGLRCFALGRRRWEVPAGEIGLVELSAGPGGINLRVDRDREAARGRPPWRRGGGAFLLDAKWSMDAVSSIGRAIRARVGDVPLRPAPGPDVA